MFASKRHIAISMRAAILSLAMALFVAAPALATPDFAAETGSPCSTCHVSEAGGGELTAAGSFYMANGKLPGPSASPKRTILPLSHGVLFFVGFVHLLASVIWFGSIFYVHIIIGPAKLRGGLPKEERILGLSSLVIVGVSGLFLTLNKIHGAGDFTASLFGKVLLAKISIFLTMTSFAMVAITVLHGRMKKSGKSTGPCDIDDISTSDGKDGRPARVVVDGVVYDVGSNAFWKDGAHMRRHNAGEDLSADIDASPHGRKVLDKLPVVKHTGDHELHAAKPSADVYGIFTLFAFTNLVLAFIVVVCIAIWRWGLPF